MHATVWSQLDQGSIVSTGLPLSALFHPTPSPHPPEEPLFYLVRHITTVLCLPPPNQPPGPLARNSNCAVLRRTLLEEPFICPHSFPQHWPDFCPSTTPTWLPPQGLCSCFLRLKTFLPRLFRIRHGSTPVTTTSERPYPDHPSWSSPSVLPTSALVHHIPSPYQHLRLAYPIFLCVNSPSVLQNAAGPGEQGLSLTP